MRHCGPSGLRRGREGRGECTRRDFDGGKGRGGGYGIMHGWKASGVRQRSSWEVFGVAGQFDCRARAAEGRNRAPPSAPDRRSQIHAWGLERHTENRSISSEKKSCGITSGVCGAAKMTTTIRAPRKRHSFAVWRGMEETENTAANLEAPRASRHPVVFLVKHPK